MIESMIDCAYLALVAYDDTEFRWSGGPYIEVGYTDSNGEWVVEDLIDVWNYRLDCAEIPETLSAFTKRCFEYLKEHRDDYR